MLTLRAFTHPTCLPKLRWSVWFLGIIEYAVSRRILRNNIEVK